MQVTVISIYEGPNIYAPVPLIRCQIDLEGFEDWPTGRLGSAFIDALLDYLPGLREHGQSEGAPGSFAQAIGDKDGVLLSHVVAHVAVELQRLGAADVSFAGAWPAGRPGVYDVVYGYEAKEVGMAALKLAWALIANILPAETRSEPYSGDGFDFAVEKDAFIRAARTRALDIHTAPLVNAAKKRGIPWSVLWYRPLIIELGHGRFRKRLLETITSDDDPIAGMISRNKVLAVQILGQLGLPVPLQQLVASEHDAVSAAERIGYPVVVKPNSGGKGTGVSVSVASAGDVRTAFSHARQYDRNVIVENFIEGGTHRMFVVDGELISVDQRVPGQVRGDGVHTIEELVAEVNRDPRRGKDNSYPLRMLRLDEEAARMLAKAGYTRETVPPPGETVYLRGNANLSTGGTSIDMTDRVHPDNRRMAVRAAAAVGRTVAGIDFITPDIGRSYQDIRCAICEVNQAPGVRVYLSTEGHPPDVAGSVIDMLYPPGTTGRIPTAAVTGATGTAATARLLAAILRAAGHTVGLATREGVAIDGYPLVTGDMTGPAAARSVLSDPMVDAAVFETSPEGVLDHGLGFDRCDVAAVLDVGTDHARPDSTAPVEMLAKAFGVVVRSARSAVVLNADDESCLPLADQADAENVCYVTMDACHPLLDEHLRASGSAVVLENGENGESITLCSGSDRVALVDTQHIPTPGEGRTDRDVSHAMFAAAMAHVIGKTPDQIHEGLCTFEPAGIRASAPDSAGGAAADNDVRNGVDAPHTPR